MELHKILVGMSLMLIMVFGFLFFLNDSVANYAPTSIPADYNTTFSKLDQNFDRLQNISEEASNQTNIDGEGSSNALSDFLGFFFGQGYKAVKTFITGVTLLNAFADDAVTYTVGGGQMGTVVKSIALTIILIIIVSLLLHFIIKSDRI